MVLAVLMSLKGPGSENIITLMLLAVLVSKINKS